MYVRTDLGDTRPISLADPELQFRGHMASAEREPITGVWGGALSGIQGQSPWSGKPPEAESILALGRPTDTANLHPWPFAVYSV